MILNHLTDEELVFKTHGAVRLETEATTNVVRHFTEIYVRDLYLARGFSSMYLMAVEEFGYDSSSALRRTHALELALAVPSVLEKIDQGDLCLQSAADIQTFLNKERGAKKAYTPAQKSELVEKCSGLSTRQVQLELASRNPDIGFSESKRIISQNQVRITYVGKMTTEEKLERIKLLRSHVNPFMSRDELLDYMAERTLEQIDPLRKAERADKRAKKNMEIELPAQAVKMGLRTREEIVSEAGEVQLAVDFGSSDQTSGAAEPSQVLKKPRSRYVSALNDRAVREANQEKGCCYTDQKTGRRCNSKHQEQRDHVFEFSRGGSNESENLQVHCAKHNRFRWSARSKSYFRAEHGML
jgi:5-methylcytosine-specific restriction endonuclease McrA